VTLCRSSAATVPGQPWSAVPGRAWRGPGGPSLDIAGPASSAHTVSMLVEEPGGSRAEEKQGELGLAEKCGNRKQREKKTTKEGPGNESLTKKKEGEEKDED